jgi:hypothetical protein
MALLGVATALVVVTAGPAAAGTAGPSWSDTPLVIPATLGAPHLLTLGPYNLMEATSCPAPGQCVGVGEYTDGMGGEFPLLETDASSSWSLQTAPLPTNAVPNDAAFGSVSCATPQFCVAAGAYTDADEYRYGLLDTLSGGAWTATQAPEPSNAGDDSGSDQNAVIQAVRCPVAGICVGVGSYETSGGITEGLIETLSNGAWTPTEVALPPDASSSPAVALRAISCASTTFCVAGGAYRTASTTMGLIETLQGTTWAPTEVTAPANAAANPDSVVLSVACPAAGDCTLVGGYAMSAGPAPFIASLSNGALAVSEGPAPAGAGTGADQHAGLESVSCPSTTYCAAVGNYEDSQGHLWGSVDTLSDGTWSAAQAPEPSNAAPEAGQYAVLYQVSCSWPGLCAIAGYYEDGGGGDHALLENLAGGTLSGLEGSYPANVLAGTPRAVFDTVSCVAAFCAAGGEYAAPAGDTPLANVLSGTGGYDLVASDGGLFSYNVPFFGSMGGKPLNAPVVGMAIDPSTDGYDEVASDGGIFSFNAPFYGSMGGKPLNAPIVGIAFDTLTGGYYEVASDGGIFAFNAPFYGSMGGKPLNEPVVAIAFDPVTGGYYEVASDGGIFAFNAPFYGSTGNISLNKPVVDMTVDTATGGYYEVASDGGLFAYHAPFLGSMGGKPINKPVVGMAFDYHTGGYFEVASDGGLFAFGAPFQGSTGNITLVQPVVGMAMG